MQPRLRHAFRIRLNIVSMCSGRFLKAFIVVLSGPPFLWFCWCWIDSDISFIVKPLVYCIRFGVLCLGGEKNWCLNSVASVSLLSETSLKYWPMACLMLCFDVNCIGPFVITTSSESFRLNFLIVFQKSCALVEQSILDNVFQSGYCSSENSFTACV